MKYFVGVFFLKSVVQKRSTKCWTIKNKTSLLHVCRWFWDYDEMVSITVQNSISY